MFKYIHQSIALNWNTDGTFKYIEYKITQIQKPLWEKSRFEFKYSNNVELFIYSQVRYDTLISN